MKTVDNSTQAPKKKNRVSAVRDPDCVYAYRSFPVSKAMINAWCQELPEWPFKNPNAKTIREFYLSKGLLQQTYNKLVNRHPDLKEAHEIAMGRLADRLWGKAVDRQADWGAVKMMLHTYSPEFDQANKYHARLKAEADAAIEKGNGNKEYIIIYKDRPTENKSE